MIVGVHVQGMDDARNVAQDCKQDVDQEVGSTATFEEHSNRWEEDGEDDFNDITGY